MTKSLEFVSKRRSAKKFIENYNLSDTEINEILESIRMAPTSFGMEPFRVIYLENKEIRDELFETWWNQIGVNKSSALLLWFIPTNEVIINKWIDEQNNRNIPDGFEHIKTYRKSGLDLVLKTHSLDVGEWAARQVYLSLGVLLNTVQELNLDICPSEGFDPKKAEAVLEKNGLIDLSKERLVLGAFLGKVDKSKENHHAFEKIRRPLNEMSKIIK